MREASSGWLSSTGEHPLCSSRCLSNGSNKSAFFRRKHTRIYLDCSVDGKMQHFTVRQFYFQAVKKQKNSCNIQNEISLALFVCENATKVHAARVERQTLAGRNGSICFFFDYQGSIQRSDFRSSKDHFRSIQIRFRSFIFKLQAEVNIFKMAKNSHSHYIPKVQNSI